MWKLLKMYPAEQRPLHALKTSAMMQMKRVSEEIQGWCNFVDLLLHHQQFVKRKLEFLTAEQGWISPGLGEAWLLCVWRWLTQMAPLQVLSFSGATLTALSQTPLGKCGGSGGGI